MIKALRNPIIKNIVNNKIVALQGMTQSTLLHIPMHSY